jgi:Fe-S cluster biogenesis protein NfuA
MTIVTERTPNPRTLKFIPGRIISPSPLDFVTAPADDAFLQEVFDIYGVTGVHIGDTFISVTVDDATLWSETEEVVVNVLTENLDQFDCKKYLTADTPSETAQEDTEVITRIKDVIEQYVRPSVANDGGDIVFGSFDEDTGLLRLSMRGACSGCPSSTATLQMGIQNLMSHFVPEVQSIESF